MFIPRSSRLLNLAVLVVVSAGAAQSPPGAAAVSGAREDLRYLVQQITTRHPNPFHLTPKAVFDREVAELSARLPTLAPQPSRPSAPLSRQSEMRQGAFPWRQVPGSRTAYVAFNHYLTGQSRSEFGDLTSAAFRAMDTAKIDRLVIDLRWNGGGDFTRGRQYVLDEIRKRDRWLKPGAFYVLIGRRTFSAAMVNTVDFKRAAGAILVGEPTGARPNSYSQTGFFQLPTSGVQATVSICRYEAWPEDVPGVPPDRPIPPTWADYRDGRDAALEWVLSQPAPDPAAASFRQTEKLTPPCRRG